MHISTALKYRPLKNISDLDLLELMVKRGSTKAETEFYYRHRSFLLLVCRKGCANFDNGEQLANDIFQNTMIKAISGVNGLYKKFAEGTTKSSSYIKAWLSVIARNELIEFLRKNPDEKKLTNPFRLKSDEIDIPYETHEQTENTTTTSSIEKESLDKGLAVLSERERDILMTYLMYQSLYNPNQHLPDEIIARLCEKHSVSSDNLRQIKRRAILKLKKECGK